MKRFTLFLFFFLCFTSIFSQEERSASLFTLKQVFSKEKVYEGEQVIIQYYLESHSQSRAVEIEVMKFPEFRNFWAENILLRQGPVQLFSFPGVREKSGSLIGSYILYPMLNSSNRAIYPLKLLIKGFGNSSETLLSRGPSLNILPLPKIPPAYSSLSFFGAVGTFSLSSDRRQLSYRLNQPFRLEITLEGEGNFPEINSLPLAPPPSCSILSESSFLDLFRGRNKKTFQWNIRCESELPVQWKPSDFLFFQPEKNSYQVLDSPEFSFNLLEETLWEKNQTLINQITFVRESDSSVEWPNLIKTPWFWWIQISVLILFLCFGLWDLWCNLKKQRASNIVLGKYRLIKQIDRAIKDNHLSSFLASTSQLARWELQDPLWPRIPQKSWQLFLSVYQEIEFSPEKKTPVSFEQLQAEWGQIKPLIKP